MSKLLINEHPLQVLPTLAKLIGLNEAIFLQQLHYWIGRSKYERDGRRWVYGTYNDWMPQFPFWSLSTIKRTVRGIEKRKLVISAQFEKASWNRKKWYSIDYEALAKIERAGHLEIVEGVKVSRSKRPQRTARRGQSEPIRRGQTEPFMFETETTHETTTETTHTESALECVGSRHSKEICRRYAQHLHDTRQGVKAPAAFAKAIYRSGEEDDEIERWLATEEAKDPTAPYRAARICFECGSDKPCEPYDPLECAFPSEETMKLRLRQMGITEAG